MSQIYRNAVIEMFFRNHVVPGFHQVECSEIIAALRSGEVNTMHAVHRKITMERAACGEPLQTMFEAEQYVVAAFMYEQDPYSAAGEWDSASIAFGILAHLLDEILEKDDGACEGAERHVTPHAPEYARHLQIFASVLASLVRDADRNRFSRRSA